MRPVILMLLVIGGVSASVPVRDACAEDAMILARVSDDAPIQIRHGVMGETIPCYAVSVVQAGSEVRGFIVGSTLPVIQEFERKRALEARIPIPAPPPAVPGEMRTPGENKSLSVLRPVGPAFEPWSGVSTSGRRMQIAPRDAKVTLVTFWSAPSTAARRCVERLKTMEAEFRPKGLKSYGFVEGADLGRANYYLEDMSLDSPQAIDTQRLAAKYNADANKGTTLVIDAANNVVAISSNPTEIRAAVVGLLTP